MCKLSVKKQILKTLLLYVQSVKTFLIFSFLKNWKKNFLLNISLSISHNQNISRMFYPNCDPSWRYSAFGKVTSMHRLNCFSTHISFLKGKIKTMMKSKNTKTSSLQRYGSEYLRSIEVDRLAVRIESIE